MSRVPLRRPVRGAPHAARARGRRATTILAMMRDLAAREDRAWEGGQCSGTMYCGDHDHYDFLNEAFANFSHVNTLQRDMCPSATKFEAEIIAMTLDLLGAGRARRRDPAGLVTSGGSGSIAHAVLAYREANATRTARPNIIKPETAHPAFAKAGHLFGVEMRVAPVDPVDHPGRPRLGRRPHRRQHGRADRLGVQLRLRHGRPDRRARRARARARDRPARRRLPRRLHPALRSRARLRHRGLRLLGARGDHRSRPTPTSTATR